MCTRVRLIRPSSTPLYSLLLFIFLQPYNSSRARFTIEPPSFDTMEPTTKASKHHVSFSESSALYKYTEDSTYAEMKSYDSHEKKRFKQDTIAEAMRLKISLMRSKNSKRGSLDGEILGIEHLVLHDTEKCLALNTSYSKTQREQRRLHSRAILMEQAYQKISGNTDGTFLAQLSATLAKNPKAQARTRAAKVAAVMMRTRRQASIRWSAKLSSSFVTLMQKTGIVCE